MNKVQQCSVCNQGDTDKENNLLSCAYCNNNTYEKCDGRALTEEENDLEHIPIPTLQKQAHTPNGERRGKSGSSE